MQKNNEKYRAVIIDDEEFCINNIRESLADYPEIEIIDVAQDAENGEKLILTHQPDLVFTDVEMSEKSGIEMLSLLQDRITWNMQIVFCTSYEKYIIDALHASALDFLLKPYTKPEFTEAMSRFFAKARKGNNNPSIQQLIEKLNVIPPRGIMIPTVKSYDKIKLEQIIYFEYHKIKRQWTLLLSDNSVIDLKRGINAEQILGYSNEFVQVNQYQIVNQNFIASIQLKHCYLEPPFNQELSIGGRYKEELFRKLDIE